MKTWIWCLAWMAVEAAVSWGGDAVFGPGMAGRFVQQSRGRTRGVLEVGSDGQAVWTADGGAAVWRGRLKGPDAEDTYCLEMETAGAPQGVMLVHDPIAPAWAIAGRQNHSSGRNPPPREKGRVARTSDYFKSRFVLDDPYEAADTAGAEARLVGAWANFAEGFGPKTLFLCTNHLGTMFADAGGTGLKWRALRVDGEWRVVAETFETSGTDKAVAFLMAADLRRETLELQATADSETAVLAKTGKNAGEGEGWEFHRVADAVPSEWERRIADIPSAIERERTMAAVRERANQAERERLERESPRQEEILRRLRENPTALLELEFPQYGNEERWKRLGLAGLPCDSPEWRAANEALADPSISFTEDILMTFLEKLPTVGHWRFFRPVFDRDELGPEARRRIAPKIADTGNYDDACVFFNHPNTPLDVLLEAEKDGEMPGGAAECLQRRLKRVGLR